MGKLSVVFVNTKSGEHKIEEVNERNWLNDIQRIQQSGEWKFENATHVVEPESVSPEVRTETYKDLYGCTARVVVSTTGKTNLAIHTSHGVLVHAKTYRTYRGAKIAMGHAGDCWRRI